MGVLFAVQSLCSSMQVSFPKIDPCNIACCVWGYTRARSMLEHAATGAS